MKRFFAIIALFEIAHADVKLVNIINLTNTEVEIFIVGPLSTNKNLTGTSKVLLKPKGEQMGLNIELLSKKNPKPSSIKIPTHDNYHYSPSGDTPNIDLIIDTNRIQILPSSPNTSNLAKRIASPDAKKPGHDWIVNQVSVKSIDNKSPYLADVRSGLKRYQEMLLIGQISEALPGKKVEKSPIILDKGQELVIYVMIKNDKQDDKLRRAEYLPTGKAETLEVIIDKDGKVLIQEHRQSSVTVPFDDEK